mmetsp:Transcript_20089/g.43602  ORF Transcript_20089/g.43602 Transcript_20089/m.43602 type:complete len:163 (+) Transcript_20089:669-1157(+)
MTIIMAIMMPINSILDEVMKDMITMDLDWVALVVVDEEATVGALLAIIIITIIEGMIMEMTIIEKKKTFVVEVIAPPVEAEAEAIIVAIVQVKIANIKTGDTAAAAGKGEVAPPITCQKEIAVVMATVTIGGAEKDLTVILVEKNDVMEEEKVALVRQTSAV